MAKNRKAPRSAGNRNQQWKNAIDQRVSSGGKLGRKFLNNLASQYGVSQDRLASFSQKNNYQLGSKVGQQVQPPPAEQFAPERSYERTSLKDLEKLRNYFENPLGVWYGGRGAKDLPGYRQLADYMGVKQINSDKERRQAKEILGGAYTDFAKASSFGKGVNNYNSLTDYLKVLGGSRVDKLNNPKPAPAPVTPEGIPGDGQQEPMPEPEMPEEPIKDPQISVAQGGYGGDTSSWATSWRGARGTRAKAGRRAQGTGSMTNRGPAANAFGVGLNF